MGFEAKIIKDSICNGQRLTTMQVTFPRIILAEWNTHCMFARNTSSSRAIPFTKMVKSIIEEPFIPVHWGVNQSGMQAFTELAGEKRELAIKKWLTARDHAIRIATELASEQCTDCQGTGKVRCYHYQFGEIDRPNEEPDSSEVIAYSEEPGFSCPTCGGDGLGLNVHKQIANRLLEPWMFTTNCTTGDASAWSNFFALRCEKDAEPHMQKIAYMAQKEYFTSTPQVLEPGQWHTPYIRYEEYEEIRDWSDAQPFDSVLFAKTKANINALVQVSTGRCARTSYLTQEGTRDFSEDIKLHDRLRYHTPLHASPFEHVCLAVGDWNRFGKYIGWKSYRHMLPREYVTDFRLNHPELAHDPVEG